VRDILRTNTEDHLLAHVRAIHVVPVLRDFHAEVPCVDIQYATFLDKGGIVEEVHRRAANETGHEHVVRIIVQVGRRVNLHQFACTQHRDTLTHRHGFSLVVSHVDESRAQALVKLADEGARLDAKLRVQVRQGLVQQEHGGFTHNRAAEGDALALTTRQLARAAIKQLLDAQAGGRGAHTLVDDLLGRPAQAQTECHVVEHGHVRVQGVALEHHRHIALVRGTVGDVLAVQKDTPRRRQLEAGDEAQRRGLATARRP